MSDEVKKKTFRSFVGRFTKLEDMLYIWIDSMRHANLPVSPSLAIAKAKSIASSLSIPEMYFKASWQWLSRFRVRAPRVAKDVASRRGNWNQQIRS
jgi:hypothetical protein